MRRVHEIMFRLPAMITCEAFEEFILAYLEDDLPRRQKIVFEMHLRLCRECRDYLKAYRASMILAAQALTDDPDFQPEDVPEDLIAAVLAARKA
jgi:predicted anti-sigma-YlaC factor YlaD